MNLEEEKMYQDWDRIVGKYKGERISLGRNGGVYMMYKGKKYKANTVRELQIIIDKSDYKTDEETERKIKNIIWYDNMIMRKRFPHLFKD